MAVGAALTVANRIVTKVIALWREYMIMLDDRMGRGERQVNKNEGVFLFYTMGLSG